MTTLASLTIVAVSKGGREREGGREGEKERVRERERERESMRVRESEGRGVHK